MHHRRGRCGLISCDEDLDFGIGSFISAAMRARGIATTARSVGSWSPSVTEHLRPVLTVLAESDAHLSGMEHVFVVARRIEPTAIGLVG